MLSVRRRDFVALLGGAVAGWPLAARAQQAAIPLVGFLRNTIAAPFAHLVTELGKGLSEEGFVEGRNVIIEQRWGDNQPDRLPGLAADLVRRKAAVIVGNTPAVLATVRVAGPTVPLVFVVGDDPVKSGSRRQPQPTGGQSDGRDVLWRQPARGKAARAVA